MTSNLKEFDDWANLNDEEWNKLIDYPYLEDEEIDAIIDDLLIEEEIRKFEQEIASEQVDELSYDEI